MLDVAGEVVDEAGVLLDAAGVLVDEAGLLDAAVVADGLVGELGELEATAVLVAGSGVGLPFAQPANPATASAANPRVALKLRFMGSERTGGREGDSGTRWPTRRGG